MDRCPNCGSSVRIGAKFCTTCGFRLPAVEQASPETSSSRSPFATTSSAPAAPSWGQPATPAAASEEQLSAESSTDGPLEPDILDSEVVDDADRADAASAAGDASSPSQTDADQPTAPFTGWPAYGTGFGPRSSQWSEGTPMPDAPPVPQEQPQSVEEVLNAWTASVRRDPPASEISADAGTEGERPSEPRPNPWLSAATATAFVVADDDQQQVHEDTDEAEAEQPAESLAAAGDGDINPGEALGTVDQSSDETTLDLGASDAGEEIEPTATESGSEVDGVDSDAGTDDSLPNGEADFATAFDTVESDAAHAESDEEASPDDATAGEDGEIVTVEAAPEAGQEDLHELDGVMPVPATATDSPKTSVAANADRGSDPGARAAALLSELQALLPALSAAGPELDVSGAIQLLEEARAKAEPDQESFQSLRAAIATAQARPRDVDVMLDLVTRASTIGSMISAHDRYLAAIDAALANLKGEQPQEPAPRW